MKIDTFKKCITSKLLLVTIISSCLLFGGLAWADPPYLDIWITETGQLPVSELEDEAVERTTEECENIPGASLWDWSSSWEMLPTSPPTNSVTVHGLCDTP